MIVVSTELVAALYLHNEWTDAAEAVLQADPEWASPMIWRALLPHALTAELRASHFPPAAVDAIVTSAPELFRGREFPAPLQDNMNVVRESKCGALMAPFVSLARGLGIPLVTTDQAALESYPGIAISPQNFVRREADAT